MFSSDEDMWMYYVVMLMIGLAVVWVLSSTGNVSEGMDNPSPSSTSPTTPDQFLASLKAFTNQLEDKLLVSKYRDTYTSILVQYDDCIYAAALTELMKTTTPDWGKVNQLMQSRESLDALVKYVKSAT